MHLFETVAGLQEHLKQLRSEGKSIGFVPTMGALHQGHLSLIENCNNDNDICICSIFINPKQFNDTNDLNSYPRDKEGDVSLLESVNCDVLFYPSVEEIYPNDVSSTVDLGRITRVLEGSFRPGHFDGVSIVVQRLFEISTPDKAYFGLKDFQQYIVVKNLTKKLQLGVEVIGCKTKREEDGLAMSSRNRLLTDNGRKSSLLFYSSLEKARTMVKSESIKEIRKTIFNDFDKDENCALEYFEIVDSSNLEEVELPEDHASIVACIAGYVEGVRLIDNLILIP